ncbi:MAG: MerR family transcriptional regulator [Pseudoflavonifractor sp.]
MKINQVEERVGITKRNIRYYEKEGLLSPGRNSENGYRDYGEADVEVLKKIKLLRKLDLPMEEIRRMQVGTLTLDDAMRRHIIALERTRVNIGTMQALCSTLLEAGAQLPTLDADRYLADMARMEEGGTKFVNIKKKDTRSKYIGPIVAAGVFIAFMAVIIAFLVWAMAVDPANAPPWGLFLFIIAIPAVIIIGVLLALVQRMKQIKGGEEDAASEY